MRHVAALAVACMAVWTDGGAQELVTPVDYRYVDVVTSAPSRRRWHPPEPRGLL